VYGIKQQLFTT